MARPRAGSNPPGPGVARVYSTDLTGAPSTGMGGVDDPTSQVEGSVDLVQRGDDEPWPDANGFDDKPDRPWDGSGVALATNAWPELERLIGPGGALESTLDGYERRSGQELMMRSVAGVLERGGTLVIEAGTGIGKSLGYLVPAALSGRRVVVSTGTRTLQDQLWTRQVPFIRDELGLAIEATVLKGRTNYLCLLLLEAAKDVPELTLDQHRELGRVRTWAETTSTGDRAELVDLAEDASIWRAVAADAEQCLGRSCPHFSDCFLMAARRRAEAADLVIVNHHLFFADLGLKDAAKFSLLPDADAVVFDEAHHLENVAAHAFGRSVSDARMRRLAGDAKRAFRKADRPVGRLDAQLAELDRDRERLFSHLQAMAPRARLVPSRLGVQFREAWYKVDNTLIGLALLVGGEAGTDEPLRRLAGRVDELRSDLFGLISPETPHDDPEVRWVERGPRATFVRSAPIAVGGRLREALFPRFRTAVFTSATLATGGGFAHVRERLGLPEDTQALTLPSPFDYASQALLYTAGDLPEPRHPAYARASVERIQALVELTRGRALVLFTSRERMLEAHAALAPRWAFPTLVQGQGAKEALLDRFRATPGAVLFATATFWEGVDIVGDALSLVIIDKLPFAPPGDALIDARVGQLAATGRNAFMEYQVPSAILALKQGVGRLIRHRGDRGIIAILDSRLDSARYGRVFLESLPPARRSARFEDIATWWAALEEHPEASPATPDPAA